MAKKVSTPILKIVLLKLLFALLFFVLLTTGFWFLSRYQINQTINQLSQKNNLIILAQKNDTENSLKIGMLKKLSFLGADPISVLASLSQRLKSFWRPTNLNVANALIKNYASSSGLTIVSTVNTSTNQISGSFSGRTSDLENIINQLRAEKYNFQIDKIDLKPSTSGEMIDFSLIFK
ncbi:MAG: hypothetical protein M1505_02025 [Patescibacteria group bacterium]|nr:hypothetical protein [Patescibacteria group bacterium]MCL5257984.1 hypothetical protein [Patescibacteria group bacterium]